MVDTIVLVGIAAGSVVFVGTIVMVYFLLSQGGSFDRMKQEAIGMPSVVGEQKPLLYEELLALAQSRQLKPAKLETPLVGERVVIRNLESKQDTRVLFTISSGNASETSAAFDADDMIWRYLDHGPFDTIDKFGATHCVDAKDNRHFVLVDRASDQPIGMMSLSSHRPSDLRVEISDVWVVPTFQGTGAAAEAVLLMMQYLFSLKYRRIEWRCDGHNVRARRFAHSMGFTFEGVMRKHRIVKDSNYDTVVFAVVNSEWPLVEEQLKAKVAAAAAKAEDDQYKKTQ